MGWDYRSTCLALTHYNFYVNVETFPFNRSLIKQISPPPWKKQRNTNKTRHWNESPVSRLVCDLFLSPPLSIPCLLQFSASKIRQSRSIYTARELARNTSHSGDLNHKPHSAIPGYSPIVNSHKKQPVSLQDGDLPKCVEWCEATVAMCHLKSESETASCLRVCS